MRVLIKQVGVTHPSLPPLGRRTQPCTTMTESTAHQKKTFAVETFKKKNLPTLTKKISTSVQTGASMRTCKCIITCITRLGIIEQGLDKPEAHQNSNAHEAQTYTSYPSMIIGAEHKGGGVASPQASWIFGTALITKARPGNI